MWLLKKLRSDGTVRYLISDKKQYQVGRKNSDIILDDPSISRRHCLINVAPNRECPFTVETHTGVWVVDNKSKYGTYVYKNYQWVRLDEEEIEELPNGMIIRFGLMENIWRVEYKPLIVCTSGLPATQIQELQSQMAAVDGELLGKWTAQCTFVIVNTITLTANVLLALINGVPIVTKDYFNKVIESVRKNQPFPDYKEFKPEITESALVSHLVSLNPEDNRKELFKGKTFVIPTEEQLENLRDIIKAAGGSVQLLKIDGNWRKFTKENMILIQLPTNKILDPDQKAKEFNNLANVLVNEYSVRTVPELEIHYAIAYSSLERYCNPKCQKFRVRHSSFDQNSYGDVIEEETPIQSQLRELEEPTTSAALTNTNQEDVTMKENLTRKRSHSPEIISQRKRTAVNVMEGSKHSDESDIFCESSNDEQDKSVAVDGKNRTSFSTFKKLETAKGDSPKDSQPANQPDNHPEKGSRKSFSLNFDYELDDFWDYEPQKLTEKESEKRKKTMTDSSEQNEFVPVEKRMRFESDNTTPKNDALLEEKPLKKLTISDVESHAMKGTPKIHRKSKYVRIDDVGDESVWFRRKNADRRKRDDESPGIIGSVARFRKEERPKAETTFPSSKERVEEIGKMLLMQGWHVSRCAKQRASGANN